MTPRTVLVVFLIVGLAGCSTVADTRLGYKSWNHFMFSLRANWDQFVGWAAVGTSADESTAEREGGWWGDEVPVLPEK